MPATLNRKSCHPRLTSRWTGGDTLAVPTASTNGIAIEYETGRDSSHVSQDTHSFELARSESASKGLAWSRRFPLGLAKF